jgi:hypothetical protein
MKSLFAATLLAAGLVAAPAGAQDWLETVDQERLQAGDIHLGLYIDGEADGFMRLGWHTSEDGLHIYDRSMWASRELYETMEGRVSAQDFTPHEFHIRFHQQAAIFNIDLEFSTDEVTGEMQSHRPGVPDATRPIQTELPDGAIARASVFVLASVATPQLGESLEVDWYAPMGNTVEHVTLTAVEHIAIETPAGPFDTIRLEQRGGSPANDIYVERTTGQVVRIDVMDMNMQFLALPSAE